MASQRSVEHAVESSLGRGGCLLEGIEGHARLQGGQVLQGSCHEDGSYEPQQRQSTLLLRLDFGCGVEGYEDQQRWNRQPDPSSEAGLETQFGQSPQMKLMEEGPPTVFKVDPEACFCDGSQEANRLGPKKVIPATASGDGPEDPQGPGDRKDSSQDSQSTRLSRTGLDQF